MSTITYRIDTMHGDTLHENLRLGEGEVRELAQKHANERQEPVYIYDDFNADATEVLPEPPAPTLESICADHDVCEGRRETLALAIIAGADRATLERIRDALRVRRGLVMTLPAHRFEGLSRGRGWCRKGKGDNAVWGTRVSDGYEVGKGKWTVGGSDGFTRKGQDEWLVEEITVGDLTWTVAN
jgi:hypothetical protein